MTRAFHLVVVTCVAVVSSGCERVAYWSGATEDESAGLGGDGGGAATGTTSTGSPTSVDEAAVLASAATCASVLYGDLATATTSLAQAADASATTGARADADAARAAWLAAMDVWEQAEAIRVGPIGPSALPGGGGLRDEIYAWPMTSRCLVEQTIVSGAYEDVDFGSFSLVNVRGLGADEYLLFYEGTDNACAPTTSINQTGAWAALSDDALAARKRDYAAAVSAALDLRARQVDAAWRSDGEGFAAAFAASGSGGPYPSTHAAVQALFDGLVVVTRQLRDDKLGAPLDDAGCVDASCAVVEAPFAHASLRLARGELAGLVRVFDGCAAGGGVGLDDLLVTAGHPEVTEHAREVLDAATAALGALDGDDLVPALARDRDTVQAAHGALSALAQVLEAEVAPTLGLTVAPSP